MRLDRLILILLLATLAPAIALADGDTDEKAGERTVKGKRKVHMRVTIVHAEGSRDPATDPKPVADEALKSVSARLASLPFQRFRHLRTMTACAGCGKTCCMRLGEGLVLELTNINSDAKSASDDKTADRTGEDKPGDKPGAGKSGDKPGSQTPGEKTGDKTGDKTSDKTSDKAAPEAARRRWQLRVRLIDTGEASRDPDDRKGKIEPGEVKGEALVKTVVRSVDGGTFVLVSPRRRSDGSRRLFLVSIGSRSWKRSAD